MVTKIWKKTGVSSYSFFVNNEEVGKMQKELNSSTSKATFSFENRELTIKRTRFWKSSLEVFDASGQIIAKTYSAKWYKNALVLEYNNTKFNLVARNNPLAEWAIVEDGKDILSYGICTVEGKVSIKIDSKTNNKDYFFDFLLWYLFYPIALENCGDSLAFLLLVS